VYKDSKEKLAQQVLLGRKEAQDLQEVVLLVLQVLLVQPVHWAMTVLQVLPD
jgi:hypothetical protein